MRVTTIELAGHEHPLCFSLSATEALIEEYGSLEAMSEALDGADTAAQIRAVDTVLSILLDAGRRYYETMGYELPPALTGRPGDVIDVTDPSAIATIFKAIRTDTERKVEAAPSKNGKPRRGQ